MRQTSSKRGKQLATYRQLRVEFLQKHKLCQCDCKKKATEVHHMAHREGEWLNHTPLWLAVCRQHHQWIEDNKTEAEKRGWIVRIYATFKDYIASCTSSTSTPE